MSERYPEYFRSNFPNNIDEFDYMNDVTGELYIALTAYNDYVKSGNFTAAMQLLNANPDLKKCIFNADKHNKILDALMALETLFYEDIETYITTVVKDRGYWSSTTDDYVKYNVVLDENNIPYIAIQDVLDNKAELTDVNYWKMLAIKGDKGDKGDKGTSFVNRGVYIDGNVYNEFEVVLYDGKLYVSCVNDNQQSPADGTGNWVCVSDVGVYIADENNPGIVKPDGDSITIDNDGTIHCKSATDSDTLDGKHASDFALKSTYTDVIIGTDWVGTEAPYSYTIDIQDVTDTCNIELVISPSITKEQYDVLAKACISSGTQAEGSVTIIAFGEKPTIDLPIRIIVRGD